MANHVSDVAKLVAVIGDEETVAGFLLAGTGQKSSSHQNYFAVSSKTPRSQIERKFDEFTQRSDIAIILINQHISEEIRYVVDNRTSSTPTVLEIPSKDYSYDPKKDFVMQRVTMMLGKE
jgi:V-type H+-transporting ATPase subunit F